MVKESFVCHCHQAQEKVSMLTDGGVLGHDIRLSDLEYQLELFPDIKGTVPEHSPHGNSVSID